jgi:ABC-type polysaccharide/polyol phosphate transport system ATPase subunit
VPAVPTMIASILDLWSINFPGLAGYVAVTNCKIVAILKGAATVQAVTEAALALRGLTKRYDAVVAVDGIDLDVPAGSFYGLLGPNGAGKTTTINMAVGLLRPDAGCAFVLGQDVWRDPLTAKRALGALPEGARLFDRLTGPELLEYTGLLRGLDRNVIAERSHDLLDVLDLAQAGRTLVVDYSAGMKKRSASPARCFMRPVCWCSTSRSRRWTRCRRRSSATSSAGTWAAAGPSSSPVT